MCCLPDPDPVEPVVFSELILDNVVLNQFIFDGEVRLAASNSGIYKLENEQWSLLTPNTWVVFDIAGISSSHYLASAQINNAFHLAESVDSGIT